MPNIQQLHQADKATRNRMWLHENGGSDKQRKELVFSILDMCENPDVWPLTDAERIDFLRFCYRKAKSIRTAESLESE